VPLTADRGLAERSSLDFDRVHCNSFSLRMYKCYQRESESQLKFIRLWNGLPGPPLRVGAADSQRHHHSQPDSLAVLLDITHFSCLFVYSPLCTPRGGLRPCREYSSFVSRVTPAACSLPSTRTVLCKYYALSVPVFMERMSNRDARALPLSSL
jgi:hypothetical protein